MKEEINLAAAKADRIPFTPFARTVIFSAAIDADNRFSMPYDHI